MKKLVVYLTPDSRVVYLVYSDGPGVNKVALPEEVVDAILAGV